MNSNLSGLILSYKGDFRLVSSEGVGWSDTSLGCPQDGYAYAQVITPGYKLVFDLAGASHAVHTNADGSSMVVAEAVSRSLRQYALAAECIHEENHER